MDDGMAQVLIDAMNDNPKAPQRQPRTPEDREFATGLSEDDG